MAKVLLYRSTTCRGFCGPPFVLIEPHLFPCCFLMGHVVLLSNAWWVFYGAGRRLLQTFVMSSHTAVHERVLWITEACNECSVSPQWGGSLTGPWEKQFVASGLVCCRNMLQMICTDWMHITERVYSVLSESQGHIKFLKAYMRMVLLFQMITPKMTTSILSGCPLRQYFDPIINKNALGSFTVRPGANNNAGLQSLERVWEDASSCSAALLTVAG